MISNPDTALMENIAQLVLPEGFDLPARMYSINYGKYGNLLSDQEVGMVVNDNADWFIVFEFDPIGYVKDDEKTT